MTSVYADNKLRKDDKNSAWAKLFDLVPSGKRVLDIGCSSGNFGKQLIKEKKCEVVGLDINDEDLKLAKRNLSSAHKRNIENDSIDDLGRFDVVIMADVIEHLIDPTIALKKIKKVLKSDGILIFSVPNMANISTRIELLKGRFEYTEFGILDQTHLHYYDRVQLEKVLTAGGFRVEKYNSTIRDVPVDIIEQELTPMGLSTTSSFSSYIKQPDLVTFQFIGVAKPKSGKHAPLTYKKPYDFMSKRIDDIHASYKSEIERLKTALANEQQQTKELTTELDRIYASRGWKLISVGHKIKHKILSIVKR